MRRWLFILMLAVSSMVCAQEVQTEELSLSRRDSVRLFHRPDPVRAVWMGAILPGAGQIYNRSYWKLPIVYGAFMGCIYAVTWTNGLYMDYQKAYRDLFTDRQNNTYAETPDKSYIAILPANYTINYVGGAQQWQQTLQNQQNTYHRYRDLSIAVTVLVYALSLVDAYVDAQLFDFDITPDLSANSLPNPNPMAPECIQTTSFARCNQSTGVKLSIRF